MIKFIRILTIIIALAVIVIGVFFVNPDKEMEKAYAAYRAGDMDQAIRMGRRTAIFSSGNEQKADALLLMSRAAEKMNWTHKAVDYLNRLLSVDNENIIALMRRGKLENDLGEYQKALVDLDKAFNSGVQISVKTSAKYLTQRGFSYLALKILDKAEKDAVTAIKFNEDFPEAHDLLSKVYETKGLMRESLRECELAYQLSLKKDKLFFTTPEGKKLSDRLVKLRALNLHSK